MILGPFIFSIATTLATLFRRPLTRLQGSHVQNLADIYSLIHPWCSFLFFCNGFSLVGMDMRSNNPRTLCPPS